MASASSIPGAFNMLLMHARPYVAATMIVGVAAAIAPVLQRLPHANNSLLFLTGVLITAVRYGVWPSIYASVLSFFVYNFFFTPPYFTLTVGEEGDVATLVFFLIMATGTGNLAARMRDASRKREQAVAELEAAKLAAEKEHLRASLLLSVSHDLRTPLSSIVGAASSVLEYGDSLRNTDRDALMQTVLDETHRLDHYIQNLLDMTRLGHEALVPERDWEDLRDLVSAAVKRLRIPAGIRVQTAIDEDAQLVRVNGMLLEQLLVNLLDNAMQHAPAGQVISVAARADGPYIVIDIADHGPGIPSEDRERVFDPFYRVADRDRKRGTGLGLAICRGIARAHGGDVIVQPAPGGEGTIMRVSLPRDAVATLESNDG